MPVLEVDFVRHSLDSFRFAKDVQLRSSDLGKIISIELKLNT